MIRLFSSVGVAALAIGAATAANAQAAAPESTSSQTAAPVDNLIGDIVVTAQKRSESLQRVPVAVTAVTGAELARSGITDLAGVTAVVPNLNLGQQLGVAKIALRGIGLENISAGAEGSIAFHVDGVFISRSIAALSSFYDIQQVEVLRGPQGTLYGRNATGGSINITTRSPTQDLSGYARVTVGNYARVTTEGAISGAIIPGVLAARIAFQTQDHNGYGRNIVTGTRIDDQNTRGFRGSLLFTPSDRLTVDVKADYFRESDRSGAYHYFGAGGFDLAGNPVVPTGLTSGGTVPANVRDISNDSDPSNNVKFWGVSGKISYELSDSVQLSSLTAFRRTDYTTLADLDSTSAKLAPTTQFERDRQLSQEFQLSGKADRLNWLVGLYYFHENDAGAIDIPFNNHIVGFPLPGTFVQGFYGGGVIKTDALAAFGQATYEVVDNLRLTLGARYSTEKKTNQDQVLFDFLTPYNPATRAPFTLPERSKRFKSFTPRIALDYQATPDVLVYGSWSKGFKSGTYNLGTGQAPVNPEKVSAFEAGLKSTLLDRRLRLNLAGFHYKYKDLQVGKVVQTVLNLENAATANIYGLEAEVLAKITPQFEVTLNGAWLHARFDNYISSDAARPAGDGSGVLDPTTHLPAFNLHGNRLSQSPDFTFFIAPQYTIPTDAGSFALRGELSWRDKVFFTPFNVNATSQAANARVNLFLNWESNNSKVTASLFVKNLTNKTIIGNSYVSTSLVGFPVNGYLEEPRTWGATVGYKF
ncbi:MULTISPECIES: TonB-dependent receptor [unclassified Sphingobium]|uniref:TonB-dependent receptor n=1 Tax=unclassified Sphingobium TaxID=2611147 RepID=UPI0007701F44|nr:MULTISPECIES: TonB-dependent receptor [unclassified Sphingobium]AMK21108.1 TonB-dependent receptor [Sphingobium sp. TKS]NML89694.1 TonB-dependent receptor [Sphingobium sp. TB-6]